MGLIGHDLYLRIGNGPVQCFRVWDGRKFMEARMEDGAKAKPPYVIELCTAEEYKDQTKHLRYSSTRGTE